ncbi:MAG TPA: DUF72 domain-containing protein, partial [Gemmatimonadales bacterium]|nr:DUF72 domain-containing protein [Gemmatimonadales bacterium]
YDKAELKEWLDRIHEVAERAQETYVITNNHYRGQAPANALMLEKMSGGEPDVPPALREAFRGALAGVGLAVKRET